MTNGNKCTEQMTDFIITVKQVKYIKLTTVFDHYINLYDVALVNINNNNVNH